MRAFVLRTLPALILSAVLACAQSTQPSAPQDKSGDKAHPSGDVRGGANAGGQQPAEGAAARPRSARAIVNQRVASFELDQTPVREAFDELGRRMGVNVVVRWPQLANEGVRPDKPISLKLRDLPMHTVLQLVMQEAAGPDVRLAYRLSRDLLLVTTADEIMNQMVIKTYDVAEIVSGRIRRGGFSIGSSAPYVETFEPVIGGSAALVRPVVRDFWSGVSAEVSVPGGDDDFSEAGRERRIRKLIEVIQTSVEPDSWQINGGRGTITFHGTRLIVRNSPLVHQLLGGPILGE